MRPALLKRELPRKLYLDNSPAFRSRHLEEITASLGMAWSIHRPTCPRAGARSKNSSASSGPNFSPASRATRGINEALECWIRGVYHQRKHLGTGQIPLQRFTSKMECVRLAHADREGYFQKKGHASRDPGRHRLPGRQTIRGPSASDRQANYPPLPRPWPRPRRGPTGKSLPRLAQAVGPRLAVNCRAKRDHHLLRLEFSSITAPTGGSLFSQKSGPEVSNS
ncbi:hypothetical protein DFAR_1430022 [Desulfarculales bacterium]